MTDSLALAIHTYQLALVTERECAKRLEAAGRARFSALRDTDAAMRAKVEAERRMNNELAKDMCKDHRVDYNVQTNTKRCPNCGSE